MPNSNPSGPPRSVFFISDGTGITAETFGNSVLSQFESVNFRRHRLPFIKDAERADQVVKRISDAFEAEGQRPIVFSTLVDADISARVKQAPGMFMDLFATFVEPLENELGIKSTHSVGRTHTVTDTEEYKNRIEAINFSLAHDDGQLTKGMEAADVILVGVSRCGKTPTSLYLAMQYGVKAANVPLIPEDFERGTLPSAILPHRRKLFGLSIQPERLSEVRHERRPNSRYASLEQCRQEVMDAERLMRREGIRWLSTTTKSIEEISTTVLQEIGLERRVY